MSERTPLTRDAHRLMALEAEPLDLAALALRAHGASAAEAALKLGTDELGALRGARRAALLLLPDKTL